MSCLTIKKFAACVPVESSKGTKPADKKPIAGNCPIHNTHPLPKRKSEYRSRIAYRVIHTNLPYVLSGRSACLEHPQRPARRDRPDNPDFGQNHKTSHNPKSSFQVRHATDRHKPYIYQSADHRID